MPPLCTPACACWIFGQPLRGPRNRRPVRADRRRLHPWPRAGGLSERAADPRRARHPASFKPTESVLKGVSVEGVRFEIDGPRVVRRYAVGSGTGGGAAQLYPGKIDFAKSKRLIGSDDVIRRLQAGEDPARHRAKLSRPGSRVCQAARGVSAVQVRQCLSSGS